LQELKLFKRYFRKRGSCLLCDILAEEVKKKRRIMYSNKHFVSLIPYYAQWPYEVHIYPKRHFSLLSELSEEEKTHLADILGVTIKSYNTLFEKDLPYIMVFHQIPSLKRDYSYYHMHIEFYQRIGKGIK
jgi:UDPglucose--hexose-1-phosphate uridylyltransferase